MAGRAILLDWRHSLAGGAFFWFNEAMKALWMGLLALSLTSGSAQAARSTRYDPNQAQAPSEDQAQPAPDSNPAPIEGQAAGGSMSLDDARMNFGTVVDSFVATRSPDGYWPLKDKTTGKVRHLKIVAKDPKSVEPGEGGGSLFIGRVTLKDESSGERLKADFTVDFGGAEWKVTQMKLIPAPRKRKSAAQAAPAPEGAPTPDSTPQYPTGQTGQPTQQGPTGQPAPPTALPPPTIPAPGPGDTPNK
jgi:hypothetical protein